MTELEPFLWRREEFLILRFLSSDKELLYLALSVGWSVGGSVGWSVCLSRKCKCPIFKHLTANNSLYHLGDDEKEEEE